MAAFCRAVAGAVVRGPRADGVWKPEQDLINLFDLSVLYSFLVSFSTVFELTTQSRYTIIQLNIVIYILKNLAIHGLFFFIFVFSIMLTESK